MRFLEALVARCADRGLLAAEVRQLRDSCGADRVENTIGEGKGMIVDVIAQIVNSGGMVAVVPGASGGQCKDDFIVSVSQTENPDDGCHEPVCADTRQTLEFRLVEAVFKAKHRCQRREKDVR